MNSVAFVLVSLSVAGLCEEESYCPSPPTPSNTSQQDLPYVESESENEWCFHKTSDLKLPCFPGYHCISRGSDCDVCPYDKKGTKTFQPQKNYCQKCILCRKCEEEGLEEESVCTRTQNTVCRDRSSEAPDEDHSTAAAERETYPPSKVSTSPSSTQKTTPRVEERDEINPELDRLKRENYILKWLVGVLLLSLVIVIVGYVIYRFVTRHNSSARGDEQDGNANSQPGNSGGQDGNARSIQSSDPGEGQNLLSGNDTELSVISSTENRSTSDNPDQPPITNSGNIGETEDGDMETSA